MVLNMSEIAQKLFVDNIDTLYVELHATEQSKMNQGWSFHDVYKFRKNIIQTYYVVPSPNTKIKTKKYNCYENNDMDQKQCLDDLYMNQLNCTFPWIDSKEESLQQCGSQHYIQDFIDLIANVAKGKILYFLEPFKTIKTLYLIFISSQLM